MFDTSRYPGRLSVALEADTIAALEAVAADANASVSSVARECIRRGLEPTREAWRKQKRRRAGAKVGTTAETGYGHVGDREIASTRTRVTTPLAGRRKRSRRTAAQIEALEARIYAILEADYPQSVRHVFYRLVDDPELDPPVPKTEQGYKQVGHRLVVMRRDAEAVLRVDQ